MIEVQVLLPLHHTNLRLSNLPPCSRAVYNSSITLASLKRRPLTRESDLRYELDAYAAVVPAQQTFEEEKTRSRQLAAYLGSFPAKKYPCYERRRLLQLETLIKTLNGWHDWQTWVCLIRVVDRSQVIIHTEFPPFHRQFRPEEEPSSYKLWW